MGPISLWASSWLFVWPKSVMTVPVAKPPVWAVSLKMLQVSVTMCFFYGPGLLTLCRRHSHRPPHLLEQILGTEMVHLILTGHLFGVGVCFGIEKNMFRSIQKQNIVNMFFSIPCSFQFHVLKFYNV